MAILKLSLSCWFRPWYFFTEGLKNCRGNNAFVRVLHLVVTFSSDTRRFQSLKPYPTGGLTFFLPDSSCCPWISRACNSPVSVVFIMQYRFPQGSDRSFARLRILSDKTPWMWIRSMQTAAGFRQLSCIMGIFSNALTNLHCEKSVSNFREKFHEPLSGLTFSTCAYFLCNEEIILFHCVLFKA